MSLLAISHSREKQTTRLLGMLSFAHREREEGKEVFFLFNATFNTFYSWLYGVRYIWLRITGNEKGNLLPSLHEVLLG